MTYGDILGGNPDADKILAILKVKPTTRFRRKRFKANWMDRGPQDRIVDVCEFMRHNGGAPNVGQG